MFCPKRLLEVQPKLDGTSTNWTVLLEGLTRPLSPFTAAAARNAQAMQCNRNTTAMRSTCNVQRKTRKLQATRAITTACYDTALHEVESPVITLGPGWHWDRICSTRKAYLRWKTRGVENQGCSREARAWSQSPSFTKGIKLLFYL